MLTLLLKTYEGPKSTILVDQGTCDSLSRLITMLPLKSRLTQIHPSADNTTKWVVVYISLK